MRRSRPEQLWSATDIADQQVLTERIRVQLEAWPRCTGSKFQSPRHADISRERSSTRGCSHTATQQLMIQMKGIEDAFPSFLAECTKTNLCSLGDHTDASDHQYYYKRRAERLK